MAPTKLTEAEKETIFRLYRETDETTSTLSRQYGVSVSTISRLLKSKMPLEEYEDLVRSKRSGLNRNSEDPCLDGLDDREDLLGEEDGGESLEQDNALEFASVDSSQPEQSFSGDRRRRRRSSIVHRSEPERVVAEASVAEGAVAEGSVLNEKPSEKPSESKGLKSQQLDLLTSLSEKSGGEESSPLPRPILRKPEPEVSVDPSLEDEEDDDYVYSFGDEEFGDEDDDFEDEDDSEEESLGLTPMLGQDLEILALSEAHFPRVCYLVVDRTGELVTCRLQDFRELGQIPDTEAQHRTLPLFDNHRIARRFSRRNQRVIKLPDGKMLKKTARSLGAKGITRLLLDGKVYDLES